MNSKVLRYDGVSHANHYRSTMDDAPKGVFVTITGDWQEGHEHFFEGLSRFGDGHCVGCGAQAWSASWVADGVFGEGSMDWALERQRGMEELAEGEPVQHCEVVIGTAKGADRYWLNCDTSGDIPAVVAHLNAYEPANNGRRAGLPVPMMEHMRLS